MPKNVNLNHFSMWRSGKKIVGLSLDSTLHFRSRFSYPQQVLNSLQSGLANLPFSHLDRAHVPYSSDPLPHHSVNNNPVIVATTAATCCVPPEVLITPAPPRSDEELVVTDSGGR